MSRKILWFNKRVQDCVKPVPFGDDVAYRVHDEELMSLIVKFLQEDVCKMTNPSSKHFPGAQPCSIFRDELTKYLTGDHLFMEKTDGKRAKFFALKLCSSENLNANNANSNAPEENKSDEIKFISLIGRQKKYRTKAMKLAEEKEKLNQEKLEVAANLLNAMLNNDEDEDAEGEVEADEDDALIATKKHEDDNKKKIHGVQFIVGLMYRQTSQIYLLQGVPVQESLIPLVLDSELAVHVPTQKHHLVIFGSDMTNHYSLRDYTELDRVKHYFGVVKILNQNFTDATRQHTIPNRIFSKIVAKPKFPWHLFHLAYERAKNGEYGCDGMISEPNKAKLVQFGTNKAAKKIKWVHSFDFMVRIVFSNPELVEILVSGRVDPSNGKKLIDKDSLFMEAVQYKKQFFSRLPGTSKVDDRELGGVCFECILDEDGLYYATLQRTDKSHPNTALTVLYTKRNIAENVTPEEVYRMWRDRKIAAKPMLNKNEQDFLNTVMEHSNWTPKMMSTQELASNLQSLDFSWHETERQEVIAPQETFQQNKIAQEIQQLEQTHIIDPPAILELHDVQKLLTVPKLKPIVKQARRKKAQKPTKRAKRTKRAVIEAECDDDDDDEVEIEEGGDDDEVEVEEGDEPDEEGSLVE